MKKLIALFLSAIMLVSIAAVSTSAAGELLFADDFSDGFTNPNNWILEGNLYFIDDSDDYCLVAYRDGVISQMEFRYDRSPSPRLYAALTASIKVQIREFDGVGEHRAGMWWRENFLYVADSDGGTPDDYVPGAVYNIFINGDNRTVEIYKADELVASSDPLSEIEVGGDWVALGWRIAPGKITGYLNDEKVVEYADSELTAALRSPILLVNKDCYVAFDDLAIGTVDYNMFGDLEDDDDTVTTAAATDVVTSQKVEIVTKVVTNEAGETEVVTETQVVNVPVTPDTNKNGSSVSTSTSTGDAAFAVVAVMLTALGCAVAVKKVNVK